MGDLQIVVWIQLSFTQQFEDTEVQYSQFSCDIASALTDLSFHSCNYGIVLGWYPYTPRANRFHM